MSQASHAALPMLKPEATIGILGGGQLGRMLALGRGPARVQVPRLLRRIRIRRPSMWCTGSPAPITPTPKRSTASPQNVDVVTYEFENVPAETATFLAARVPVLPDPKILAITQDRLAEKKFVTALGIRTAPFAEVASPAELAAAIDRIGRPAVLKTRRFGYDGKGQAAIRNGSDPTVAWREVGGQPCILEAFVPFEREVSVIAARGGDGAVECFDVTENEHRDHILKVSRVPATLDAQRAARGAAHRRNHRA